ncbi:hypothetical protein VF14_35820 [Nostoc linckia z18]|uniref:Retroviral-like aspartic protease n=2 Tax=Nostoc linckia TaxID=92942 RepID=A0A9Q5ZCP4_NOSLI|nr:hypothetical protein [Nostoc linckia]PHK27998.1 hypothetical protein VF12_33705 [Nostoc linckia z15]PHK38578.1 hypothetical protein VF13_35775 [Nostoc linckia z16]PHJ64550.1 hypothetical protein VF02_12360 [Nostoc linckia z1]PHJ69902.1 hypothetical protein VF05_12015 [Nostoc linckia z3]PHJ72976.1 hypothetical protein VF03_17335 [Nostoc linckia z2]
MVDKVRFRFTEVNPELGALSTFPYLPLTLTYQNHSLNVSGLLDTGSSVNVLPYEIGLRLGAVWERQTLSVPLGGNLSRFEARALVVIATVEQFPTVELAFAWTRDRNAPLVLGQMNFFLEFNVCFYRADLAFEISPKKTQL